MLASSQNVKHNAAFFIDTFYLDDWRDLQTDINMKRSATKTYYFQKIKDQLVGGSNEIYMYKATRFVYAYKDHADFH